jgi:hypothetical protein
MHFAAFQFISGVGRFSRRPTATSSQVDPKGSTVPERTGELQPKSSSSFRRPLQSTVVPTQTNSILVMPFLETSSEPKGPFKAKTITTRKP